MTTLRSSVEIIFRVRWLPVIVVLLCMAAIIWTLLSPDAWKSAIVLAVAALPLAILGRESTQ